MNKNSNTYQILYSAVMVVLVGAVLAFVYMALKPKQDENIANDTRRQILSALKIDNVEESKIPEQYQKHVVADLLIDREGNIIDSTENCAFDVNMKKNSKLPEQERQLPLFRCKVDDGSTKYVIPVYGAGLWGPIWGYVSVNDDGKTIYCTDFSHDSETPGLGARITEDEFQLRFCDKALFVGDEFKVVSVVKKGQKPVDGSEYVDAITGATITSRGVSTMMSQCLAPYEPFLRKLNNQ